MLGKIFYSFTYLVAQATVVDLRTWKNVLLVASVLPEASLHLPGTQAGLAEDIRTKSLLISNIK